MKNKENHNNYYDIIAKYYDFIDEAVRGADRETAYWGVTNYRRIKIKKILEDSPLQFNLCYNLIILTSHRDVIKTMRIPEGIGFIYFLFRWIYLYLSIFNYIPNKTVTWKKINDSPK